MFTRRFAALLVVLLAAVADPARTLSAQDRVDTVLVKRGTPSWSIGSIEIQLGVTRLGLDELNTLLAANGRPVFPKDAGSISISSHARFGRLMIGGSGEAAAQRKLSPGWVNRIWLGSAMIDGGVALIDLPNLLVYPVASLGIRRTSLHMEQSGDLSYVDAVQNPGRGVSLTSLIAVAGIGLVTEFHFNTRPTGDFSIGVRAGYMAPLGGASTSAGESSVSGAPKEKGGQFLRLSVGKPIGKRSSAVGILSTILLPMTAR